MLYQKIISTYIQESPCGVDHPTCGITVSFSRRSCRPILAMSTPSTRMRPLAASMMRNRDRAMEDLPAPVRPTMPSWKRWQVNLHTHTHIDQLLRNIPGSVPIGWVFICISDPLCQKLMIRSIHFVSAYCSNFKIHQHKSSIWIFVCPLHTPITCSCYSSINRSSTSEVTVRNMDKSIIRIHQHWWYDNNQTKQNKNKIVSIFHEIYSIFITPYLLSCDDLEGDALEDKVKVRSVTGAVLIKLDCTLWGPRGIRCVAFHPPRSLDKCLNEIQRLWIPHIVMRLLSVHGNGEKFLLIVKIPQWAIRPTVDTDP